MRSSSFIIQTFVQREQHNTQSGKKLYLITQFKRVQKFIKAKRLCFVQKFIVFINNNMFTIQYTI